MISVVIITHNRECEILERALSSVIHQSYQDIEIIVVNDSDRSFYDFQHIREMMDSVINNSHINIRYIEHESPKGACAARNTGLKNANGDYIAFLDDDDEWEESKLFDQLIEFEKSEYSNLVFVYCGALYVYDDENYRTKIYNPKYLSGSIFDELLEDNFVMGASFPLIKSSAMKKIGGFDTAFPSCQDWDMWLRLSRVGNASYVNKALVKYHVHKGDQITKNFDKRVEGIERLINKNKLYYEKNVKAYYKILERLLYEYATNRKLEKSIAMLSEIVNKISLSFIQKFILFARMIKWIVIGGHYI